MTHEDASASSSTGVDQSASSHQRPESSDRPVNGDHTPEAGPSRRPPSTTQSSFDNLRPASPETALSDTPRPSTPHLDLATYPTTTLLRLLASLLQQIATSNDSLRPDLDESMEEDDASQSSESRSSSSQPHPSPTTALFTPATKPLSLDEPLPLFTASRNSLSHPSSLLSFHARHVPSISIEAYLLRILKYCPTTNEVFLGLLVYFDRMSRLGTPSGVGGETMGAKKGVGRGFAIDSYNVHRLVIAGVTVASKFFSDVFYTNSRYAKVGGLPSHELNQLELQFLLLNDFLLVIPPDEMQRYGDRLLGYWEVKEAESQADVEMKTGSAVKQDVRAEPQKEEVPETRQEAPPKAPDPVAAPNTSGRRERDTTSRPSSVSFAETSRPSANLRGWGSGDVRGDVIAGRMTSPMRD